MLEKLSKTETQEKIDEFFKNIKDKTPKEIKKIKKLAMKNNLQLKENKKEFCKKCYSAYKNPKIRIKNGIKSITCEKCSYVSRWKIR